MSYFFRSVETMLQEGDRKVTIEPVLSFGIDDKGWPAAGVYRIHEQNLSIGYFQFKWTNWHYEGIGLNETEQEALAYFIRFYDGEAA